jgi:hypothetical protein
LATAGAAGENFWQIFLARTLAMSEPATSWRKPVRADQVIVE